MPLVSLVELGLHVKQTSSDIVGEADWTAAREIVKPDLRPDDLIVFSPFWTDALGRQAFGDLANLKREGRSDVRRFARAFEVSRRDEHTSELAGWKMVERKPAGRLTVTLWENPAPSKVIDDLLDIVNPERLTVTRVDGDNEQPCPFARGASAGGSTVVPQGLLTPADKFVCPGGHVGVAVVHGLDHHPHLCIYATPLHGATLRMKFSNVAFGPSLVGHSAIQWMVERTPSEERVGVSFFSDGHLLGTHAHKVGAGWGGFELPTPELDGKRGDLVAEIAPSGQKQFCFEATTRREAK